MSAESQEIRDVVDNAKFKQFDHGLADYYWESSELFTDEWDPLRELIHRGVLIDLGCGSEYKNMADFAIKKLAAEGYVGVDSRNLGIPMDLMTKITFHQADMLEFLSQQQDNSAAITINAIDEFIIDPVHHGNAVYIKRLAKEVMRVARGYCVFGLNSPDIFNAIDNLGAIKDIDLSSDNSSGFKLYTF